MAARTLGDLVRKLGERVLPEIIPILEDGLNSERGDERQGVCIGLSEIMDSTSREMVCITKDYCQKRSILICSYIIVNSYSFYSI